MSDQLTQPTVAGPFGFTDLAESYKAVADEVQAQKIVARVGITVDAWGEVGRQVSTLIGDIRAFVGGIINHPVTRVLGAAIGEVGLEGIKDGVEMWRAEQEAKRQRQ